MLENPKPPSTVLEIAEDFFVKIKDTVKHVFTAEDSEPELAVIAVMSWVAFGLYLIYIE